MTVQAAEAAAPEGSEEEVQLQALPLEVFPDADVDGHIILLFLRKLARGQVGEEQIQRPASLYFGLLADHGGYDPLFDQLSGGGNHIVSNNAHPVMASQYGDTAASAVDASGSEIQRVDFGMVSQ